MFSFSAHRHSALFQQNDKSAEMAGSTRSWIEGAGEATNAKEADEFDAFEPPLGPSGPVDLEAELFAFKSFPQLPQIHEELIDSPRELVSVLSLVSTFMRVSGGFPFKSDFNVRLVVIFFIPLLIGGMTRWQ